MKTFDLILNVLLAGLQLWSDKEATKYRDRAMKLKRKWYDEYNKPLNERSDAVLDNVMFELELLANGFTSRIGAENNTAST